MLRRKLPIIFKNRKDAAIKRKILKTKKIGKFPMQHDQESRAASLLIDQVRSLPELLFLFF